MDSEALATILSGANPLEKVVAVEPLLDRGEVQIFVRMDGGETEARALPFVPWLIAREERHFDDAITTRLEGDGYCWRIDFHQSGWDGYKAARWALADEHVGILQYASAAKQFLIASGITLFKGMGFDDLRRVQIDIETTGLSPTASDARIFMISLGSPDGAYEVLDDPDERLLLEAMAQKIALWDPDVIEGHNLYGFDLPYIAARFAAHGMECILGRDPAHLMERGRERNVSIGAHSRPFTPYHIFGRHVIDTLLQVQRFDLARGQISSYGLKECARVYKIAPPDRVYLDRADIVELHRENPERVATYARQDVEEARCLAALVAPIEFYQTQLIPDIYQSVAVTGNGEKLNSLLVREYLRQNQAIPQQSASQEYPGGYTEVRRTGVIRPIVKADVESLYPSIMLTKGIKPRGDSLDIFLPLLQDLTRRRLEAKGLAKKSESDSPEFAYWDGMQNSYKTMINSFYGYVGGPFFFNDYTAARAVTLAGREIVLGIAEKLEETGSSVVEIDTDGVYFQPPQTVRTEAEELAYVAQIGATLPDGIRLAHDGSYEAMLSLKIKNYVLVEPGGRTIFKGSSLRSRADEPFGRKFLIEAVRLLIAEQKDALASLYQNSLDSLQNGLVPIEEMARRERVTTKMLSGTQKKRADALKSSDAKAGDIVMLYQRADKTMALMAEYSGDEDRDHYAEKLYKFASRLSDAFEPGEFERLFPRPLPEAKRIAMLSQPSFDF